MNHPKKIHCPKCDKRFAVVNGLRMHVNAKHGGSWPDKHPLKPPPKVKKPEKVET